MRWLKTLVRKQENKKKERVCFPFIKEHNTSQCSLGLTYNFGMWAALKPRQPLLSKSMKAGKFLFAAHALEPPENIKRYKIKFRIIASG